MAEFRLSVAPMVGVTTRPFRALCRLLSPRAVLYTEMVVDDVLLNAKSDLIASLLTREANGHVVLQLAGHVPDRLARAAEMGQEAGFTEINLNCGCPSSKAQRFCHGAALMRHPDGVRELVAACTRRLGIPVTVKCRLGVDDIESYEHLSSFIATVAQGGCRFFSVHARKALLDGLGTKGNRRIPPLNYEWVSMLAKDFPDLKFELNGGLTTLEQVQEWKSQGDLAGVMIGREIWHNPCFLARCNSLCFDQQDYHKSATLSRGGLLEKYLAYWEDVSPEKSILSTRELAEPLMKIFHATSASHLFRIGVHQGLLNKTLSLREIVESALEPCPRDVVQAEIV